MTPITPSRVMLEIALECERLIGPTESVVLLYETTDTEYHHCRVHWEGPVGDGFKSDRLDLLFRWPRDPRLQDAQQLREVIADLKIEERKPRAIEKGPSKPDYSYRLDWMKPTDGHPARPEECTAERPIDISPTGSEPKTRTITKADLDALMPREKTCASCGTIGGVMVNWADGRGWICSNCNLATVRNDDVMKISRLTSSPHPS